MGKFQDLTGKVFNNLLVLERVSTTSYKKTCWKCKCNCGNLVNVTSTHLKSGNTTSCGCTKNRRVTINVEGHCLRDYCKKFNLNYNTILSRITKSKWPINKAISTPIRHRNPQ